ncbi:MAG: hypothetical protein II180_11050 [Proteobacteria bacterium]|nr:hypothetical protein [Pseudomonadota bacterium]
MKNAKQAVLDLDPMLIQSWYDGELDEGELEEITVNDIAEHPMVDALEEIGALVRNDVENAFSDLDEDAMWSAISRQINANNVVAEPKAAADKVPVTHSSRVASDAVAQPARSDLAASGCHASKKSRFVRWIPTLIGAALFLFSLPGLITMIQQSDNDKVSAASQPAQTVVVVDAKSVDPATQSAINYAAQNAWNPAPQDSSALIPRARINNSEDQLTVEEMDKALKLVLQRLEYLEQQNQQRLERGDIALQPAL